MSVATYRKIVVHTLSVDIRKATKLITVPFPTSLRPTELVVKNKYVGINASDINFTAGIYQPDVQVPFDCGFEAMGEVVGVGSGVKDIKVGDVVITESFGSFAEYQVVPRRHAYKAPTMECKWLPLALSGVTASIAIEEVIKPQKGERAVVTAAAGGTGQFAAQLLQKVYGCPVVGVCSTAAKGEFLEKKLGCHAAILSGSTPGQISEGIRNVFPQGVHIAYESVGGTTLDDVVDSLTLRGRILSIGSISCYQNGSLEEVQQKPLPLRLLAKSASLSAFFLPHYTKYVPRHLDKLFKLVESEKISSVIDPNRFRGLTSIYDAVDLMYSRKNCGKIVVEL